MRDAARFLATTVRSLARQPAVALPAVLILALGIGLTTALFSYWSELFWPHLDAPAAERVVNVQVGSTEFPMGMGTTTDFEVFGRQERLFSELVAYCTFGSTVAAGERNAHAWGYRTSGGYFAFFAARPAAGRLLQPSDDRPGAPPVAVLGHHFWQGTLGGDPAVVGREIRVNGSLFTVVGVTAAGFQGHGHAAGLYVPLAHTDRVTGNVQADRPDARWLVLLGRLAPGLSLAQARAAADALAPALDEGAPLAEGPRRLSLDPATEHDPEEVAVSEASFFYQASRLLLAAAALFLLLGCASTANLLLARATARQREWGIRTALGAGRWRLAGAALAESLLLSLAGGLLGLPVALLLTGRIEHYLLTAPGGLGGWSDGNEFLRFDLRALGFALAASLASALLGGLGPALRAGRRDPLPLLRAEAAGPAAAGPWNARQLLVVLQVALSVLLLVGGGLLVRTLARASQADPGIEPRGLAFATLYLPRAAAGEDDGQAVYARLAAAVQALPGVEAAGVSHLMPLAGWTRLAQIASADAAVTDGGAREARQAIESSYNFVGPGYFEALGLTLEEGRAFSERDGKGAPGVAVVSRAFARRMWGAGNALGRRLMMANDRPGQGSNPAAGAPDSYEVVGVAEDIPTGGLLEKPGPMVYFAFPQRTHPRMTLVVRSATPLAGVADGLRKALPLAHPDLSLVDLSTGPAELRKQLHGQRLHAEVAALFGLLGLGVATVGLFGLLSYSVTLRERELGIRQAVGAEPGDLLRLVVRQGMTLVVAGVIVGLAGAYAASRLLAGLLYGVGATDPSTYLAVAVGLAGVGLAACYLPARRAAALDPAAALKGS